MSTEPETVHAFDFLCEHTPSKSRVMALVGDFSQPRSLAAVLTCKDKEHAYQAVQLLRHTLATRDEARATAGLQALACVLPEAPLSSLRHAVTHAAAGTWPAAPGVLYAPQNEAGEDDAEDDPDGEPELIHPPAVPHEARLKDLPGKVVRIAILREFHITDQDVLIRAAIDADWEPVPASELDEDDPRDLVGAVMMLSDQGAEVPGADCLEDQVEAGLLRVEDHDEVAAWSEARIRTRFLHGGRLRQQPADAGRRLRQPQDRQPDLAALFPVKDCDCDDEECADCGWQLTPRTADILLTSLSVLGDQAYDDADELGDHPVTEYETGNWEVFSRLPALTFKAKRSWRRKIARAFDDLAGDIERGQWPQPSCTAEEMALHLAIEDAPIYLEDVTDHDCDHNRLPTHEDDYDWSLCSEVFFQDHDVLMLFNARFDGIEDPDSEENQALGSGDMRLAAWFEPFLNTPVRDTDRGFRR